MTSIGRPEGQRWGLRPPDRHRRQRDTTANLKCLGKLPHLVKKGAIPVPSPIGPVPPKLPSEGGFEGGGVPIFSLSHQRPTGEGRGEGHCQNCARQSSAHDTTTKVAAGAFGARPSSVNASLGFRPGVRPSRSQQRPLYIQAETVNWGRGGIRRRFPFATCCARDERTPTKGTGEPAPIPGALRQIRLFRARQIMSSARDRDTLGEYSVSLGLPRVAPSKLRPPKQPDANFH
jgi:hypothetical protein